MEPIDVIEYLNCLLEDSSRIEQYIVAQEKHKDGDFHIHVYLKLVKKVNISNCHWFDLVDEDRGVTFHGKYEGCRNVNAVMKYVVKDGNYVSSMSEQEI